VNFRDVSYVFDGVHVEHGQQHERFSRIDMKRPFITRGLPEPVLNLPWGSLFVAIMLPQIKQGRPHVDKVRPFPAFLRWAAIHDLWWGMQTVWKLARFVFDTILIKRRFQIGEAAGLSILGELNIYPNFDKIAFKLLEDHPEINTVIFGHTHVLKHKQWKEGKEYINEGTWNEVTNLFLDDYGRQIRLTYAYIDYPVADAPARARVRLKQWHGVWRPESEILV
jgi:UDP-2,3-diacylglucosamine pyrophosphatase LpxH